MEHMHFSHVHGLVYHQMPQGTEVQCSGCKCQASDTVFACLQCKYFLHEKCFQASRSLKHPSHPTHTLTLVPYPTYPTHYFCCDSCNLVGSGFCYCCSECEFDLHVHCAFTQNPTPLNENSSAVPNYPNHANKSGEGSSISQKKTQNKTEKYDEDPRIMQIKAMDQMARLQFRMQMNALNAKTMQSILRTDF